MQTVKVVKKHTAENAQRTKNNETTIAIEQIALQWVQHSGGCAGLSVNSEGQKGWQLQLSAWLTAADTKVMNEPRKLVESSRISE